MAITTRTKRMSIAQLGGEPDFLHHPTGGVQSGDRLQLLALYPFAGSSGGGGGDGEAPWFFIYTGS